MISRSKSLTEIEPRILFESGGAIFVDKPAGLPSTGRTLDDPNCLQSLLIAHYRRRRIWAVHQLDAATTGVNIFVRRKALVATWSQQLKAAQKRYLAFVSGVLAEDEYVIDAPLGYCERSRRRKVLTSGQAARSQVWVRQRFAQATEIEVSIETGRTHQVRLHLEHIGHPILGDARYANREIQRRHPRQALHALEIRFTDGLKVEAEVPPDLHSLREALRAEG
jgi:23S rRNA-/tRNA-specific pseudouridylate synthase